VRVRPQDDLGNLQHSKLLHGNALRVEVIVVGGWPKGAAALGKYLSQGAVAHRIPTYMRWRGRYWDTPALHWQILMSCNLDWTGPKHGTVELTLVRVRVCVQTYVCV